MNICVMYVAAWVLATVVGALWAGALSAFILIGSVPFALGMWLGYHEGQQSMTDQINKMLQDVGHK